MLVRDERGSARLDVPTTDLVLRDAEFGKQRRGLVALGTFAQRTPHKGGSAPERLVPESHTSARRRSDLVALAAD